MHIVVDPFYVATFLVLLYLLFKNLIMFFITDKENTFLRDEVERLKEHVYRIENGGGDGK